MSIITKKELALINLNAFAMSCKAKLTAADQLAQVDAMVAKAQPLTEEFYAAIVASTAYRAAESEIIAGRVVGQAVVAA